MQESRAGRVARLLGQRGQHYGHVGGAAADGENRIRPAWRGALRLHAAIFGTVLARTIGRVHLAPDELSDW